MTNANIDILNDVTKTLIDSKKGYETACDMSDDSFPLRSEFRRRASERQELINEFQQQVRSFGGEPETDGGAAGAAHRAFSQLSSLFRDDEKAALSAIDDGEEYLAEQIEDKIEKGSSELTPEVRQLLNRALAAACEGERFAERMEDHV
ncbi:MAG: PA2169 family four-helix-bundle protein [Pseudomonadota bacterium]